MSKHVMFKRNDGKYICNKCAAKGDKKTYKDIEEASKHSTTFDNTPNAAGLMQAMRLVGRL